jgi:GDP-L-fucose synthase
MESTDFYECQKVVVLGGAGFVGRHLCKALEARGAKVYVVDNFSRSKEQRIISGDIKIDIITTTRLNDTAFFEILSKIDPFAVFNLAAAVANVEYNQKHHNQMFLDNVQLQTIPVMVCERIGVPHFLQVSSACVYGADANAPSIETNLGGEPVVANAGYSWSKRMGERAVQWSDIEHAVIVRPSNIYGPGDWYDERAHVIPQLIKGYAEGTVKLFGEGIPVREFIYVEDAAEGMIHALEHGSDKEAYNLGSNSRFSIATLHQIIASHFGMTLPPPQPSPFDQGDEKRFSDCNKMTFLGWMARTSFRDGLTKTIEDCLGRITRSNY